ncbi:hypothetical protein C8T65DRAFT_592603, partial [Cerioporus squamosus]
LIDWLRLLYEQLEYTIRFDGDVTATFRALAGILIGDPASPILWILFISDLSLATHLDDVVLDGQVANLLLIADDVLAMSMSDDGILEKGARIYLFCALNFLVLCVIKTLALLFGPLPASIPLLTIGTEPVSIVDTATYAGMTFTSTKRDILAEHYAKKAKAARNIANTSLSLESSVGTIPPPAVLTMYRAQVEPHLVYGCEVALDVSDAELKPLQAVQHTYLRRALGLGSHSQLTPLFTETGIWPLRYRRAALVLRYLRYILRDEPTLALAAVREAWMLAQQGNSTWWSDLCHSLVTLPVPVAIVLDAWPTPQSVAALLQQLEQSLAHHLYTSVRDSRRLPLLWARFSRLPPAPTLSQVCAQQPYLKLTRTKPREALIRLLTSDHPFGIEVGRRRSPPIPSHRRVCRFCRKRRAIEDEVHTLLECGDARLEQLRESQLIDALLPLLPGVREICHRLSSMAFLNFIMGKERLLPVFAQYVLDVFQLVESVPFFAVVSDSALLELDL